MLDPSKSREQQLFATHDLREKLEHRTRAMREEVERFDANRLLNTSPSDLAAYLAEKYRIDPLTLRREEWVVTEEEIGIRVHDPSKPLFERARDRRPGQRIEVIVPFDGDAEMFYCRAAQFTASPPAASICDQEIVLTFEFPVDRPPEIRSEAERVLGDIERHIAWGRALVDPFNSGLPDQALEAIEARRNRILANQGRIAALGIPVRARADAPRTYAIPNVRRKATPSLPPATSTPFEPEPTWAMEHYEHALNIIQQMTVLMERTPSAFSRQTEEHLRDQFLFQLNAQFEGRATGETFNLHGKTDILLRENGRNVFIAECKFWKGPKKFSETIDQLLGYTSWRDTKTAILVFNRGTDTSLVLKGISGQATLHPNYKRTLPWRHESGFRYVFHHQGDPNREFILTVLAFHVPS